MNRKQGQLPMSFEENSLPKPVALNHVRLTGGLWHERQTTNRERTIPAIYHQLEQTGRIDAWRLDPNRERPKNRSVIHMFFDSDTGKWLEAVGYSLHTHPDDALAQQADAVIELIREAQQPDGYLNTYFSNLEPENRWRNLRDWHEMYNAGHLIEGAIAYYQATEKRTLLDVVIRFADHIETRFGPREGQRHGYPGHPELELALVKLWRHTGDRKYLELSRFFVDERGREPHYFDIEARERGDDPDDFWAQTYKYCQAHKPVREQDEATGHAVRACYLYAAIADIALETQDEELIEVSRRIWDDLAGNKMYITGGLGPAHSNEGFTFAYDLPNETAYAETCAAISLALFAHRMFHLEPDSRYIDVMERALYNNVLSGVSYDGEHFFYANPLASYPHVNPYERFSGITTDEHYRRQEWFFCPCCPPNLARIVAGIGAYFYSTQGDRFYVHLYNRSSVRLTVGSHEIGVEQQTNYPWDGTVQLTIQTANPAQFDLALRIPGWCREYTLDVNGERQTVRVDNGYAIVSRPWQDGDQVTLVLDMPVERMQPHHDIRQNAGQIALQRGPLVYCLEQVDNGRRLANVAIGREAQLEVKFDRDLFGGIAIISGTAVRQEPSEWAGELYQSQSRLVCSRTEFGFKAIPYYLWANREPGEMRVWIREL